MLSCPCSTCRSNKIVPQIYRAIIDDVIANVNIDFEEYGMDEDLLATLQSKWEAKLLESRVADFARAPAEDEDDDGAGPSAPPSLSSSTGPNASGLPGLPNMSQGVPYGYAAGVGPNFSVGLSSGLGAGMGNGVVPGLGGQDVGQFGYAQGGYDDVRVKDDPDDVMRLRGGSSRDIKPDLALPTSFIAPPPAPRPEPNAAGLLPGDEVIDSDLDDSDDELRDDDDPDNDDGEVDIVFCVYDRVQRVKNKWKTVFKDGMIHINGKDYLFAKCQGEFEW